jgi:Cysteine rich repeat
VKINRSNRPRVASARLGTLLGVTIAALAFGSTLAAAQTKVPEAMRNQAMSVARICRADYDRFCANVQPGGGRILACLSANAPRLSGPCRAAMPDAKSLASRAAAAGVMPK